VTEPLPSWVAAGEEIVIAKAGKPMARLVPLGVMPKRGRLVYSKGNSMSPMISTDRSPRCARFVRRALNGFLLDTHVLLWALDKPDRLPEEVLHYLETPDNEVYFSAVSILEIAIKTSLGRVNFSYSPEQIMQVAQETGNCLLLPNMPPKLPNCLHIITIPSIDC